MKIGILSDTHNRHEPIEAAFDQFKMHGVSTVIHCGDWMSVETMDFIRELVTANAMTLKGVLGNNDKDLTGFGDYIAMHKDDFFDVTEGILECTIESKVFVIYRGHHIPTRKRVEATENADVILLGHSHKPRIEENGSRLIINPGSTAFSIPRSKQWRPTIAIYSTRPHQAELIAFDRTRA
jgi:putative phosphoesterase